MGKVHAFHIKVLCVIDLKGLTPLKYLLRTYIKITFM